ncbi:MAG: hypothetical protein ACYTFY_00575 [Planctomycetota bacterium]|jgi:hypothetical protein
MPLNKDDYLIIIRAAGERTESLCRKLAEQQGYPENVIMVKEVPFHKSLVKGFKIAMDYNHRWTFCVDADILLAKNTIAQGVSFLDLNLEKCFRAEGSLIYKFHQAELAGLHCYRTEKLNLAYKYFDEAADNVKPETYISRKVMQLGHKCERIPVVFGTHEYGLSFNDIYRRYKYRASKCSIYEFNYLKNNVQKGLCSDEDCKVALCALIDGKLNPLHEHSKNSVSDDDVVCVLKYLGLKEKDKYNIESYDGFVDKVIREFKTPDQNIHFEEFLWGNVLKSKPKNLGADRYAFRYEMYERLKLKLQRFLLKGK